MFTFTFVCTDDFLSCVSDSDYDIIIIGGGDVVNSYFFDRVKEIVKHFHGPVYALSVGIGYETDAQYLGLCDHTFVRSDEDFRVAGQLLGAVNVTHIPDLCFSLSVPALPKTEKAKIAVCLAEPVVRSARGGFMEDLAAVLKDLCMEVHILPFNIHSCNPLECDIDMCHALSRLCPGSRVHLPGKVEDVIPILASMDTVIAMRYHSAVIGIVAGLRVVVIQDSPKMRKMADDLALSSFSCQDSLEDINTAIASATTVQNPWCPAHVQQVRDYMSLKKFAAPIVRPFEPPQLEDALAILSKNKLEAGLICHILDGRHGRQPDIYMDLYTDRTFHWGSSAYEALGILPRTTPWIGIVHHTFDQVDVHNSVELFKKKNFIESLKSCTGLCALSEYLASQLRNKLSEINVQIPVHVLYHPTEVDVPLWSSNAFQEGPRLLVQVGSWMRDESQFECLDLGTNLLSLFKMRVGGKRHPELKVPLFPRLNDQDYDLLLTRSVVFLALRDCSAANTILECKARGTPLIINRHDAIVEALGPDYPGYYKTLEEAKIKLNSMDILEACNRHLDMAPGLLRDRLQLDNFVRQVSDLLRHDSKCEHI
ncbi:hypothetical protein CEUSTIGMA_g10756.t1 [Chlamydomonas eustigma]|uniref:Polysaccharide pyruvyl transferase domain-containing protein n=1 Tax=Chlamydomonas eustigma TaxID=1157962 RepID=A0A250XKJ8_9CHLO|nr:hypothetical protein CEUSTIGMA_g10756.t1 [Chlamydomonas eustigma]|eukprot:GAX83330.1 hypothetical protein CEUSTIGMA_g10756.t1 [Chlamydomonas eustigma]